MRRLLALLLGLVAFTTTCTPSRTPVVGGGLPVVPGEPVPVVIWSSRDLPAGLHQKVAAIDGVRWVTRMTVGMVDLVSVTGASRPLPRRASGAILPLSIAALEPSPGGTDDASRALSRGQALMSATAAGLRGIQEGARIRIGAEKARRSFTIGAVVPDDVTRGREVIIPLALSTDLGLTAPRTLISSVAADRVADAVRAMQSLTAGVRARILAADVDVSDAVESEILPFVEVKRIFGEFTYRPTDSRFVVVDRAWEKANIVEDLHLPLLGLVTCNRRIIPQLVGAMRELIARGLSRIVRTYNGCYSPRMQVGNAYALSRHAYGIAVDINAGSNRYGEPASQDPRLVEVMERWGFSWGGRWLVPDGMHFEFVRFVADAGPTPAER